MAREVSFRLTGMHPLKLKNRTVWFAKGIKRGGLRESQKLGGLLVQDGLRVRDIRFDEAKEGGESLVTLILDE